MRSAPPHLLEAAREAQAARSGRQDVVRWHRRSARQVGYRLLRALTIGCQLGSAFAIVGYLAIDFTGYLFTPEVFVVPHISVQGNTRVSSIEVLEAAHLAPSIQLWSWPLADIRARAEQHPRVRRARVERTFPDGLRLTIEERPVRALLLGDPLYEVDADGVVLGEYDRARTPFCPIVTGHGIEHPVPGMRIESPAVREALAVIASYETSPSHAQAPLDEVALAPDASPVLWLHPGVQVPYEPGMAASQWSRLAAVLDDLRARGTGLHRIAAIDLRFAHVVPVRLRTVVAG